MSSTGSYHPRDLANYVFELYLKDNGQTRSRAIQHFDVMVEIRKVIDENIDKTILSMDQYRRLVRSIRQHFYRLEQQLEENPDDVDVDGKWVERKSHQLKKLSDLQESMLVGLLLCAKRNHTKITIQFVKALVNTAFATSPGFPFGVHWCKLFVKRYGHLWRFTTKKRISPSRTSIVTFNQSRLFSEVWCEIIADYQNLGLTLNPDIICNVDEILLHITENGRVFSQLILRDGTHGDCELKGKTIGSMIAFVSANGNVPFIMFCMKKKKTQRKYMIPVLRSERATRFGSIADVFDVDHCTTETGYITEKQFQLGLAKFAKVMRERCYDKQIILLADNLRSHRTLTTLQMAQYYNITFQMFTPNASHFLQPLDNILFAVFKMALKKTQEELDASLGLLNLKISNSLCCSIATAFRKAFTPHTIRQAFANVGVWPYSHETIMENACKATEKESTKSTIEKLKAPLQKEVCRLVMAVHEQSLKKIQSLASSGLVINVQPKTAKPRHNSATIVFQNTGGRHEALLEHERKEAQQKAEELQAKEQRKRARELQKEVREVSENDENDDSEFDLPLKRPRIDIHQQNCAEASCKYMWHENGRGSKAWQVCPCRLLALCPIHRSSDALHLKFERHLKVCSQEE